MPKILRRLPTKENLRHATENKSGSEALEMVYSTAALCVLILTALTILMYALQMNAVSYAAKRIARYIEVSGVADDVVRYGEYSDLDILLRELLPNADEINAEVQVVNTNYFNMAQRKIQLRERFTVIVTADYWVTLLAPGGGTPTRLSFPIRVTVNGQSEVYWKS